MLYTGEFDADWRRTVFVFLPKSGNLEDPTNWRTIAILRICYNIFARLLYNRIKAWLVPQQSPEQMGFLPGRSAEDAMLMLEETVSKSFEFNMPLFFAGLDLRKAFDRLQWPYLPL